MTKLSQCGCGYTTVSNKRSFGQKVQVFIKSSSKFFAPAHLISCEESNWVLTVAAKFDKCFLINPPQAHKFEIMSHAVFCNHA